MNPKRPVWGQRTPLRAKAVPKKPAGVLAGVTGLPASTTGGATSGGPATPLFAGQLHPKKQKKITKLDQWVEVRIEDGRTVTTLYPSNEGLIQRGQRMLPPPELVYRRLNFPDGIPPEYWWTCSRTPERRERGGMGTQRMTVETWIQVIAREKERGDGHVGPTGVGNLPRPEQYGECPCETCQRK